MCVLAGDPGWTDYRVWAELVEPATSVAGVVVRSEGPDDHVRLIVDGPAGRRALVRLRGGTETVLWQVEAPVPPGAALALAVEAVGHRWRGVVGDVTFEVDDPDGPLAGRCGPLSVVGGRWRSFLVDRAALEWEDWYTLGSLGSRQAGRRVRVHAGRSQDPGPAPGGAGEERLFAGAAPAGFVPRLPGRGVDLRLVDPLGRAGHTRRHLPDSTFVPVEGARLVRSRDGTGVVVLVGSPVGDLTSLPAGTYRLTVRHRRDNRGADPESPVLSQAGDTGDETVELDVEFS